MDLVAVLALCRLARDAAALLLWGSSVYIGVLGPKCLQPALMERSARWRSGARLALLLAVSALLPGQAASLGDGWPAALDPATVGAMLTETTVGTAWIAQGAMGAALLLVRVLPGRWRERATAAASGLLLAALTISGHAAAHEGWLGAVQRANALLHVLCAGFWLGALVPLLPTLALLSDPDRHRAAGVALRRFSCVGHGAVLLVIVTGALNTALILGRWPTDWHSPYEALLAAKIGLVALMVALALINRYGLVPRLRSAPTSAAERIRHLTVAEVLLGLGAIALVAIFGQLDPA